MQRQPSHTKTMRRRDTLTDTRLAIHDQVLLQSREINAPVLRGGCAPPQRSGRTAKGC